MSVVAPSFSVKRGLNLLNVQIFGPSVISEAYLYSIPNLEEKIYVAVQWGMFIIFGLFALSSLYALYKIVGYKKES